MELPAHDGLRRRGQTGLVPVRGSARERGRRLVLVGALLAVPSVLVVGHAGGAAIRSRRLTATNPPVAAARPATLHTQPDTPATTTVASSAAASTATLATAAPTTVWAIVAGPTPTFTSVSAPAASVAESPTASASSSSSSSVTAAAAAAVAAAAAPEGANRPIPVATDGTLPSAPAPPWAASIRTTDGGYLTTNLGCASATYAAELDAFFAERLGPVLGMDYQHVYPLGGQRFLWLFQDMFIDQPGTATTLGQSAFTHNAAMVQDGACFTLVTRGSVSRPASFEQGTGESVSATWFWPMGGELVDGQLRVFWAEMHKDGADPGPGDGLGWHPTATWLATYDAGTLARLDFRPAPNAGAAPIYGYAVAGDGEFSYLFGNTFEQNLDREGGYGNGPHSATRVFLGRVPEGQLDAAPEYWTVAGWTPDATQAQPISQRFWVENPMQPRFLNGKWVAATKVDGYWGEQLSVDVAEHPWGPWTTTEVRGLVPRGGDALTNSYHAHLMPWLDGDGGLIIGFSRNARNMARDAWPHPERYRPAFTSADLVDPPQQTVPDVPTPDDSTTQPTADPLAPAQRGTTLAPTDTAPSTEPTTSTSTSTSTSTTVTSTTDAGAPGAAD